MAKNKIFLLFIIILIIFCGGLLIISFNQKSEAASTGEPIEPGCPSCSQYRQQNIPSLEVLNSNSTSSVSIVRGNPATLRCWNCFDKWDDCYLVPNVAMGSYRVNLNFLPGNVSVYDFNIYPTASQSYQMQCVGAPGCWPDCTSALSGLISVKVCEMNLVADKYYFQTDSTDVTVSWTAEGGNSCFNSCTLYRDSTAIGSGLAGSASLSISQTTNFKLSCNSSKFGTINKIITIAKNDCSAQDVCLIAEPPSVPAGSNTTLKYRINVSGLLDCSLTSSNNSFSLNNLPTSQGEHIIPQQPRINEFTTFTLRCWGKNMNASEGCDTGGGGYAICQEDGSVAYADCEQCRGLANHCNYIKPGEYDSGHSGGGDWNKSGGAPQGMVPGGGHLVHLPNDPNVSNFRSPGGGRRLYSTFHAYDTVDVGVGGPLTACSCTATATPNPIPAGQSTTTIDAIDLNHTSKSNCKVEGYGLPHTFTQTESSHTYTVNCIGDSGYTNCSCDVTVTKGTTKCNTTTYKCDTNGTGPSCSNTAECCGLVYGPDYACRNENVCDKTDPNYSSYSGNFCGSQKCCKLKSQSRYYACNTNTWQCYASTSGQYASLADCEQECKPCTIANFNFTPSKVFLGRTTTADWTTLNCESCQASCEPLGCGNWSGEKNLSDREEIKPTAVGIYDYTLSCKNQKTNIFDSKTVKVEVYRAPIWREIAPLELSGFLWSIIFGK